MTEKKNKAVLLDKNAKLVTPYFSENVKVVYYLTEGNIESVFDFLDDPNVLKNFSLKICIGLILDSAVKDNEKALALFDENLDYFLNLKDDSRNFSEEGVSLLAIEVLEKYKNFNPENCIKILNYLNPDFNMYFSDSKDKSLAKGSLALNIVKGYTKRGLSDKESNYFSRLFNEYFLLIDWTRRDYGLYRYSVADVAVIRLAGSGSNEEITQMIAFIKSLIDLLQYNETGKLSTDKNSNNIVAQWPTNKKDNLNYLNNLSNIIAQSILVNRDDILSNDGGVKLIKDFFSTMSFKKGEKKIREFHPDIFNNKDLKIENENTAIPSFLYVIFFVLAFDDKVNVKSLKEMTKIYFNSMEKLVFNDIFCGSSDDDLIYKDAKGVIREISVANPLAFLAICLRNKQKRGRQISDEDRNFFNYCTEKLKHYLNYPSGLEGGRETQYLIRQMAIVESDVYMKAVFKGCGMIEGNGGNNIFKYLYGLISPEGYSYGIEEFRQYLASDTSVKDPLVENVSNVNNSNADEKEYSTPPVKKRDVDVYDFTQYLEKFSNDENIIDGFNSIKNSYQRSFKYIENVDGFLNRNSIKIDLKDYHWLNEKAEVFIKNILENHKLMLDLLESDIMKDDLQQRVLDLNKRIEVQMLNLEENIKIRSSNVLSTIEYELSKKINIQGRMIKSDSVNGIDLNKMMVESHVRQESGEKTNESPSKVINVRL